MAQYIVHPAEAGASAADRYGMTELQGLSEQTSNFVNNAALQMRQMQEQKAKTDVMRGLLNIGINPMTGGTIPVTALGRTANMFPEAARDLALTQMGLTGFSIPYGQVQPSRLSSYNPMQFWPGASVDNTSVPFGQGFGATMPTDVQLEKQRLGIK